MKRKPTNAAEDRANKLQKMHGVRVYPEICPKCGEKRFFPGMGMCMNRDCNYVRRS